MCTRENTAALLEPLRWARPVPAQSEFVAQKSGHSGSLTLGRDWVTMVQPGGRDYERNLIHGQVRPDQA